MRKGRRLSDAPFPLSFPEAALFIIKPLHLCMYFSWTNKLKLFFRSFGVLAGHFGFGYSRKTLRFFYKGFRREYDYARDYDESEIDEYERVVSGAVSEKVRLSRVESVRAERENAGQNVSDEAESSAD